MQLKESISFLLTWFSMNSCIPFHYYLMIVWGISLCFSWRMFLDDCLVRYWKHFDHSNLQQCKIKRYICTFCWQKSLCILLKLQTCYHKSSFHFLAEYLLFFMKTFCLLFKFYQDQKFYCKWKLLSIIKYAYNSPIPLLIIALIPDQWHTFVS